MTDALPGTPPGFDQPIAMLKHCHDKIRKQLGTLVRLLDHLPEHGADAPAQEAAAAVIKYFEQAAPFHHADEEEDLLPMLKATALGADLALLKELAPEILRDHDQMDALWQDLHEQLAAIAAGSALVLSATKVREFNERYLDHMEREETFVAPMAKRLFSPVQMVQLGDAMQRRRGVKPAVADATHATQAAPAGPSGAAAAPPSASSALPVGEAVAALRTDYGRATLDENDVADDPIAQFSAWFEQALAAQVNEPNAMGLSTVDAAGKPSSRIVLVKQFDARGFTWYTNYDSTKGKQLRGNPHAALLFFWSELERQVRVEGKVERTSAADSDQYFHSRPLKSRLAAIASAQSAPIDSRAALEQHYDAAAAQGGDAPPRPAHWGGFRLVPTRIEFWQGRRSRFHDRVVYTLQDDGSWTRQRLQP